MASLTQNSPTNTLVMEYNFYKSDTLEKALAQKLLQHLREIPGWTIEQAANACGTSVSTMRRFIHGMGYDSYTDFRCFLEADISNFSVRYPPEMERDDPDVGGFLGSMISGMTGDLAQLRATLDQGAFVKAATLLHGRENIFVYDLIKGGMRLPLVKHLAMDRKLVTCAYDYQEQTDAIRAASPQSAYLLVMSSPASSRISIDMIPEVREAGAAVIAVTNQMKFLNRSLCDAVIQIPSSSETLTNLLLFDLVYRTLAEAYRSLFL